MTGKEVPFALQIVVSHVKAPVSFTELLSDNPSNPAIAFGKSSSLNISKK